MNFTSETLAPPLNLPKHSLLSIKDATGQCLGFYVPDLEKLLDLKNIRQHLQALPSNYATKVSSHKGSFISVQGVLRLLEIVKSKHLTAFKTWFLDTVLSKSDPDLFKNFEGGQQKKRRSNASDQELDSPPQKKQKVQRDSFKFCDRVYVNAEEVHGLVYACNDLCKTVIDSPQVHNSQRTFLDGRNRDLKNISRDMKDHEPKICLLGEPASGKSFAANKIALLPKAGQMDDWGKQPLDNRAVEYKVTSVTFFNYHLKRSDSQEFTIYAVTCPLDTYQERGGTCETLFLEQLNVTLQFGQRNIVRRFKSITEVSNWSRYFNNTSVPESIVRAIDYIEIHGPWDMPEKLELVDTVGLAESSSLQSLLVKKEVSTADMILLPKATLLTAESLKFLERQGAFANPARGLPMIGVITKADSKMTLQEEEDKQMEMIMSAADDTDLLTEYDPMMRLSLLGDIAARVIIIHPETMLVSAEARKKLFAKILDGIRVNSVRVIVRGACSLLFAINVMGTTDGKASLGITDKVNAYASKINTKFDSVIDSELQDLVSRLEKLAQNYYSKVSMDQQSRTLAIEAMGNLCLKKTLSLLRKIRGHGETWLKRHLQDLMKKLGVTKGTTENPLLEFSIAQMDSIYSESCVVPIHSSELFDMKLTDLISSWIKRRSSESLEQLMQSIRDKVKSYGIPDICKNTFQQVCQQITDSLAKEISLPKGVLEKTKELIAQWRKILLDWFQNANYRLDMVAKKISRQSAENPLTGLFGNEHQTVMESIVGEIYQKVTNQAPAFVGEVLQLHGVKTTGKEDDVITFERDVKLKQVTMVMSPRVKGLLENIANKMRNHQGKGGLCLFIPSKAFNEHGCKVQQKRIDFECLEGDMDHLITLVIEESQLNMYREHYKKVAQLCLPSKLEVIFSVVPDNSEVDIFFETIRLIATQFKIPYIIRVPDNVEAFSEFKLIVLRLRQCTPARAFMWTQSFLIELETELWQKSLEVIRENEDLLMLAVRIMDFADSLSYIAALNLLRNIKLAKDQGKLEACHLERVVHLLQKQPCFVDGIPQAQKPILEDVVKQLAKQLAVLQSLVAISCKVNIDTYRHNFKKWPMYMGVLPPGGYAIQGPVVYRTDALYNISFCTPDNFLNGQTIPTNLGEVRSKKGSSKANPKTTLRAAKWIDHYKKREQNAAKVLRDYGFVQLQNYLFTWSAKTRFRKGQITEVMKRAPETDSSESTLPSVNSQMSLGNLVTLSSSFATPALQAFSNYESTMQELRRQNLRIQDNLGGGDCLVYSILDHLKELLLFDGDHEDLRGEICEFAKENWMQLATYDELAPFFDTEEKARRWAAKHRTPRTWCATELAMVAAIMFGVDLEYYVANDFGELLLMKFSPHEKRHDESVVIAYVNNNHWVSVWPIIKEGDNSEDESLIESASYTDDFMDD